MIRASNYTQKERHSVSMKDFKGVDYSTAPVRVALNHATEMSNFIYRDGTNQKRHGWEDVEPIPTSADSLTQVNSMYVFKRKTVHTDTSGNPIIDTKRIVFNNGKLLANGQVIYDDFDRESGGVGLVSSYGTLDFFPQNNKLYIIGCGRYLVYNGVSCGTMDDERVTYAYPPTTTINISERQQPDSTRDVLEAVNLLTTKRKNLLVGVDADTGTWALDSKIKPSDIGNNFTASKVTVYIKNTGVSLFSSGMDNTLKNIDGEVKGSINLPGNGRGSFITLNFNTKPPIPNESNIEVTFTANIPSGVDKINKCKFGQTFGLNGNSDRLFLAGNDNRVYYSESQDFTYFPDTNYLELGSSATKVKAFLRLQDNVMAIFKETFNENDANVYYISGKEQVKYNDAGLPIDYKVIFPAIGGVLSETPIDDNAVANFGNDNLILSKNGLFALQLTQNLNTTERRLFSRSYYINDKFKELLKDNKPHMFVNKDKLYLALGDECFVADSMNRSAEPINGTMQYEWWHWNDIGATCWASDDGELIYGHGSVVRSHDFDQNHNDWEVSIRKFNEEYRNIAKIHLAVGQLTYSVNNGLFTSAVSLKENDFIKMENAIICNIKGKVIEINETRIIVDMAVDGVNYTQYLRIDDIVIGIGKVIDVYDHYAEFNHHDETIDQVITGELAITHAYVVGNGKQFKIKRYVEDVAPLEVLRIDSEQPTANIESYTPIIAKWVTPVLDMGTNETSKTLLKLTISTDKINGSQVKFGYDTRTASKQMFAKGTSLFDFNNLSFEDFTFETGFMSSYSQLVKTKFNYIVFAFQSDNDKNCGINDFTILYKYNKRNKGVN